MIESRKIANTPNPRVGLDLPDSLSPEPTRMMLKQESKERK
jgi:hypothetical protein